MAGKPKRGTPGPEPKGGPSARREAFMQERQSKLGPKTDEQADVQAEALRRPGAAGGTEEAAEVGPDFRQNVVSEYRRRQQAQMPAEAEPPARPRRRRSGGAGPEAALEEPADSEPQPPSPPPANNWIPIGPSVVRQGQGGTKPPTSGRILGIAVAAGGNRVYAASSNGGVWRSDDAGANWRSLMDAWDLNPTNRASDSLSCGAIAIDPGNPDRIFVGTGDGDEAMFLGVGPVFSPDGGTNWFTEPVAAGNPPLAGSAVNALAVDPGNTDRVVAGTFQGLYRREPAGAAFQWVHKAAPAGAISSVAVARTGGTTRFFAAPWAGPVFSSTDGSTWTQVGTGFPAANVGRVGLAVQAASPNVLYALVAGSDGSLLGIYRLDDMAGAWRQISGAPGDLFGPDPQHLQGTYDLAIAVDPNNADLIYVGGSTKLSAGEWSGCSYRCAVTSTGSGSSLAYSMTPTYIGDSHHADTHTIVFAPGDSNLLWLGCDGGAFSSTNPTGAGDIFAARNTGLQTLETNFLAQHPTEDAVAFCGTQDNGGVRFTGEEAWYHSAPGDGGCFVVNWNDPYRVLSGYVLNILRRTADGGTRYNYVDASVPLAAGEQVLFYPPIAGVPPSGTPAEAERVAFGSTRLWISDDFGSSWTAVGANIGGMLSAIVFASFTVVYVGTTTGRVYRYVRTGATWTATRLDNAAGGPLPLAGWVRSIAVDPADPTGNAVYIAFAGTGDWRHVWHFDGTQWQARSGPAAGSAASLIDVQHNAIVCDPAGAGHVYVGADIGIWRSTDGGANWATFSAGLPDAGVLDLDLHNPRRLLRAATYGRGVFEYDLAATTVPGINLYVRDTQLDQGRIATVDFLPDPTAQGQLVRHWAGPDIKLDTPDTAGNYQFPITPGTTIDFEQFDNDLTDDFQNVATYATATIVTRVYVQVHNRGVTRADNVRVMLLLANASAGLPNLPAGFAANVQSGTPLTTPDWKTVGFANLNDVRVGFPKIAAFDLLSSMLPPPASLAGNDHHCVLALVHHASDPFTATQTVTDLLSVSERKAAHKNLKVVQFTGTLPPAAPRPAPLVLPFRINNPYDKALVTTVQIDLGRYAGRVRAYFPTLKLKGAIAGLLSGGKAGTDRKDFQQWAMRHIKEIESNQAGKTPFDHAWSEQRRQDVEAAYQSTLMVLAAKKGPLELRNIVMKPHSWHTIFLLVDRPQDAKPGVAFPVEIRQLAAAKRSLIGGLSARIEIVPQPRKAKQPPAVPGRVPAEEVAEALAGRAVEAVHEHV